MPAKAIADALGAALAPTVFISYSHKDDVWLERFRPHLGMLQRDHLLQFWSDLDVPPGADIPPAITAAMQRARVAVLLISADYLDSDFARRKEIPPLFERRIRDGLIVIPVMLRACLWRRLPWLADMKILPKDARPIAAGTQHDWDQDFTTIADAVLQALQPPAPHNVSRPDQVKAVPAPATYMPVIEAVYIGPGLTKNRAERMFIRNVSSTPALNVRITPMKVGHTTVSFGPLSSLQGGAEADLKAQFDHDHVPFLNRIFSALESAYPGRGPMTFKMEVRYTDGQGVEYRNFCEYKYVPVLGESTLLRVYGVERISR